MPAGARSRTAGKSSREVPIGGALQCSVLRIDSPRRNYLSPLEPAMSKRLSRVSLLTSSLALFLAACGGGGGGIEGKYYNQNGAFVMELKGGKVSMAPGMEAMNANYEARGDSAIG